MLWHGVAEDPARLNPGPALQGPSRSSRRYLFFPTKLLFLVNPVITFRSARVFLCSFGRSFSSPSRFPVSLSFQSSALELCQRTWSLLFPFHALSFLDLTLGSSSLCFAGRNWNESSLTIDLAFLVWTRNPGFWANCPFWVFWNCSFWNYHHWTGNCFFFDPNQVRPNFSGFGLTGSGIVLGRSSCRRLEWLWITYWSPFQRIPFWIYFFQMLSQIVKGIIPDRLSRDTLLLLLDLAFIVTIILFEFPHIQFSFGISDVMVFVSPRISYRFFVHIQIK